MSINNVQICRRQAAVSMSPAHTTGRVVSVNVLAILALGGFLFLSSCTTTFTIDEENIPEPLTGPAASFAEPGPEPYSVGSGSIEGRYGCATEYELYYPKQPFSDAHVFIGHGFMRDLRAMRGWAAHLAAHGIPATVVSFCNSTIFNGRHDRNAEDLIRTAESLHDGPVIYAGFSAGGLSAYLAAGSDDRAVAYLGLDAVDSGDLAQTVNQDELPPSLILIGEASSCNAENNILDALRGSEAVTEFRVANATHCHFEYPYGPECESLCGKVAPQEASDRIIETIRSLSVAWILYHAGGSEAAETIIRDAFGVEVVDRGQSLHADGSGIGALGDGVTTGSTESQNASHTSTWRNRIVKIQ